MGSSANECAGAIPLPAGPVRPVTAMTHRVAGM